MDDRQMADAKVKSEITAVHIMAANDDNLLIFTAARLKRVTSGAACAIRD